MNRVIINLRYNSNNFYTSILNQWCKSMTQEEIADILAPRHATSSAPSIENQIIVSEEGDYKINKVILDAFMLYSSEGLGINETSSTREPMFTCEVNGCTGSTTFGFSKYKPSVCVVLQPAHVFGDGSCKSML